MGVTAAETEINMDDERTKNKAILRRRTNRLKHSDVCLFISVQFQVGDICTRVASDKNAEKNNNHYVGTGCPPKGSFQRYSKHSIDHNFIRQESKSGVGLKTGDAPALRMPGSEVAFQRA